MTKKFSVNQTHDFALEVAMGNIPAHSVVIKFGANPDVAASTHEDIWDVGGIRTWLTVASTLEAISADANDTAAGSGARTITVEGLNAAFESISETITMAGTSASTATTNSFIRVNRAFVVTSGTYGSSSAGSNAGTITIRLSSAGATQAQITNGTFGIGSTLQTHYTVPSGKTAFILSASITAEANKPIDLFAHIRPNADDVVAPFTAQRVLLDFPQAEGSIQYFATIPVAIPAKTDIWFSGIAASGAAANIGINYTILLKDD